MLTVFQRPTVRGEAITHFTIPLLYQTFISNYYYFVYCTTFDLVPLFCVCACVRRPYVTVKIAIEVMLCFSNIICRRRCYCCYYIYSAIAAAVLLLLLLPLLLLPQQPKQLQQQKSLVKRWSCTSTRQWRWYVHPLTLVLSSRGWSAISARTIPGASDGEKKYCSGTPWPCVMSSLSAAAWVTVGGVWRRWSARPPGFTPSPSMAASSLLRIANCVLVGGPPDEWSYKQAGLDRGGRLGGQGRWHCFDGALANARSLGMEYLNFYVYRKAHMNFDGWMFNNRREAHDAILRKTVNCGI